MRRPGDKYKKANNIAIVVFGGLFIVGSFVCLAISFAERNKHDRWQAAPQLRELSELRTIGPGNDVTIAGSIAPDMPASNEGLALYETWELEIYYSNQQEKKTWKQIYAHKPDLELLFGGHSSIVVQSERAVFQQTKEVQLDFTTKLTGFAPGDEVIVMGGVTPAGNRVQALILCGGDREQCLGQMSTGATIALVVAAIVALGGIGLVAWGVRRLRT
jgi:hypothetical protein